MNIPPNHQYSKLRLEFKDNYIEKNEDLIENNLIDKNTIYENDYDIKKPISKCKRFLLCFNRPSNINQENTI